MTYPHTAHIKKAIKEHLLSGDVGDIFAFSRLGWEGDPIVEIRVSILSDIEKLDGRELSRLKLYVRDAMEEVNDNSFPILRVMDKKDWDELQNEAA